MSNIISDIMNSSLFNCTKENFANAKKKQIKKSSNKMKNVKTDSDSDSMDPNDMVKTPVKKVSSNKNSGKILNKHKSSKHNIKPNDMMKKSANKVSSGKASKKSPADMIDKPYKSAATKMIKTPKKKISSKAKKNVDTFENDYDSGSEINSSRNTKQVNELCISNTCINELDLIKLIKLVKKLEKN